MNDTFLRACRGDKVDYTPIWIMRQAGRYLPEYQKVRAGVDFLTLCKTPSLAAEVTLQPVDILGVDAAILFSDILIPVEAMGMKLRFLEEKGPVFENPVRERKSVDLLTIIEPEDEVPFVIETIKVLRRELEGRVPLIGFSGAPFTLATYMVEGGGSKNFINTKKMMYQNPPLFSDLMEKITQNTIAYLAAQIKAGVQAVQLFDSWAGVLSPVDYETCALPYIKKTIEGIKKEGVPVIYFVNDCAGILSIAKKAGSDVMGIDWRIDMGKAVKAISKKQSIQGNLDPCMLFSPVEKIRGAVSDILEKASGARGHIFNLGHGVLPETSVDSVKALINAVHELSSR
jgi:uroporphyrinogen decarboxylase